MPVDGKVCATELSSMDASQRAAAGLSVISTVTEESEGDHAQLLRHMFELDGCEGYQVGGLGALLRKPNVAAGDEDATSVCAAVNGAQAACATRFPLGRMVAPGSIGLIDRNGRIEAVPDGRYALGLSRASWLGTHSLTFAEPLREGALTMVRVPRGQLGLARHSGNAVLLDAGLHVYNDVRFAFDQLVDVNSDHIHHGPLHVLRVRRGQYARAWLLGASGAVEPKLLREGCHAVDSNLFSVDGRSEVADSHVSHAALHILQVPKGSVAKVFKDNVPRLLAEGCHYIDSTNFEYCGVASLGDPVISHGTITIVRVNRGQVGLAWQENQPLFLQEPGLYNFDSPSFKFVRHASIDEKMIELGTKKIVTVYSGEVGLSYQGGELQILSPGRHIIEDPSHVVRGFLSTQQQSVRLVSSDQTLRRPAGAPKANSDLLVCETKDLVKVGIRADVFYAVESPEKALQRIAQGEIETLLLETSLATITNIIRSTTLNEIAQSKHPSAVSSDKHIADVKTAQALGGASAPLFFDKAHDEFLSKLHDDFLKRYGIEIANIRIESFKIMDEELANSISKQALTTAKTENQLANLASQTEIATKEQERLASVKQISAAAEANALKTGTDARNSALLSKAEAEAKAEQIRLETAARAKASATVAEARADAEAIRLRGQAEAEAFELKANAEAKRAQQLAETPLGAQLSLLTVYSEMAAKSNEGVQKVVYSDLQQNNLGLLAMPSLQNLGRDLSLLQGIDSAGGARGEKAEGNEP